MMKNILKTLSVIFISLVFLVPSYNVLAKNDDNKTIGQLKKELADYKAKKANADKKQNLTKAEINNAKANVSNKQNEITVNQQKVNDAINESARLEVEIANGKAELDKLIKNYQIASGDNLYLEYIFEATSYEDLIYRYAVMEQIMNYQEEKIASWKDKIEYNEQLKVDLAAREVTLNNQIKSLADDIEKLNDELEDYYEISLSYQDEIDTAQKTIDLYTKMGCKDNQTIFNAQEYLEILD